MSKNLTVKAVAERLSVGVSTVYDLCRSGILPSFRVGCGRGTIRITPTALDRYFTQQDQPQAIGAEYQPRVPRSRRSPVALAPGEKDYFSSLFHD